MTCNHNIHELIHAFLGRFFLYFKANQAFISPMIVLQSHMLGDQMFLRPQRVGNGTGTTHSLTHSKLGVTHLHEDIL
jgi:hypothetical protein